MEIDLPVTSTRYIKKVAFLLRLAIFSLATRMGRCQPTRDNVPGRYFFAPYFGKLSPPTAETERTKGDLCSDTRYSRRGLTALYLEDSFGHIYFVSYCIPYIYPAAIMSAAISRLSSSDTGTSHSGPHPRIHGLISNVCLTLSLIRSGRSPL